MGQFWSSPRSLRHMPFCVKYDCENHGLREMEKSTAISLVGTFSWWFTGHDASAPRKTRLVAPRGLVAASPRSAQRWGRQPACRGRELPRG